ncbi:hypothetical protein [Umezawaea sp. Da 62-37]|uniref:hypothetical protein n=1 Tax=Umezawaea sp. Da 62-37 TaxID=3075927 RepID=UPI0028F7055B|nr:hypothetical protein [Umezawaea sp. Da 62-37]WNV85047.1 hypothetical protein RM788_44025 [Umezawaea sp. Da 62-37]
MTSSAPSSAWTLAPLLAARQSVRLWSPHRGYDHARRLGRALPEQPAAIPLYDKHRRTTMLALDFDPKGYGPERVRGDAEQAVEWVHQAGGLTIVDESTRGGRHVLVPLADDVPLAVRHVMPVLRALAARLLTLDITPMSNPRQGCITAPGSPCKEGGHRRLLTPLDDAFTAARTRSQHGTIARLSALLSVQSPVQPHGSVVRGSPQASAPVYLHSSDDDRLPALITGTVPSVISAFALAGVLPDRRTWRGEEWTRHEARQSFLAHAVLRGLSLNNVLTSVHTGVWPGFRDAYNRYGPRWEHRLRCDWVKAMTWAAEVEPALRVSGHQQQHTGGRVALRSWLAQAETWTMTASTLSGQTRWTALAIWQALAYISQLERSHVVAPGRRWLSIAAGLINDKTVSQALRFLRELPGAPILLVERGSGAAADKYALVTPRSDGHEIEADPTLIAHRKVGPVHPAWHILGLPARRVFDAIERHARHHRASVRPLDLPELTGMCTPQVYQALRRLAKVELLHRGRDWVARTTRTLAEIATEHGLAELRAERIAHHRRERRAWHDLLAQWEEPFARQDLGDPVALPADPLSPTERADYLAVVMATGPPPQEPEYLMAGASSVHERSIDLLEELLGASPVTA